MKAFDVKQLDEKDEEVAVALISLGISRYVARTLSYLRNVEEATSFELEKVTGLRQPEASIAMKELRERDWVNVREGKKPGKGRPYKIYSLKTSLKKIVANLEKQQKRAFDESQAKIERLRELRN